MKFGRKLSKKRKGLAVILSLMMCLGATGPVKVKAASADDRYTGGNSIEDILTNFQYFVDDDAMIGNHTVGPVAIGGKLTGGKVENGVLVSAGVTFGDGAHSPSYAKEMFVGAVGSSAGYGGTCRDFYYGSLSDPNGFETDLQVQDFKNTATLNPDYIDVDGMFDSIKSESEAMVNGAIEAPLDNNTGIIECDFTGNSTNYKISYDNYVKAEKIVFKYSSVDDIRNKACTVNIVGVGDNEIFLAGEYAYPNSNSNNTMFGAIIDGQAYNDGSFLQKAYDDDIKENECNISGMKLIINMPDANKFTTSAMGGHIVAPYADLTILQGRFEGGIIAKSVTNPGAEGHYFPYNALGEVVCKGTFSKVEAGKSGELEKAELYIENLDGTSLEDVERVSGPEIVKSGSKISWISGTESLVLSALPDGEYKMVENTAPAGYDKASDIEFMIKDSKIYQKIDGSYKSTSVIKMEDELLTDPDKSTTEDDDSDGKTTEKDTTDNNTTEGDSTDKNTTAVTTESDVTESTEGRTTEEMSEDQVSETTSETVTTEVTTETAGGSSETVTTTEKSTTEKTTQKTNTDSVVRTGDNTNVVLLLVGMVLSIAGVALLLIGRKKLSR